MDQPNHQSSLRVSKAPYPMLVGKPKHSRSSSGMDPFHFDQDSRYPVHRSNPSMSSTPPERSLQTPTPPLPPPKQPASKPQLPPTPPLSSNPPPALQQIPPSPPPAARRKSILKSWKSSGSFSTTNFGDNSVSSVEQLATPRMRRRPSIPDAMRKSLGGVDPQEIPPSPEIPRHYAQLAAANRTAFPTSDGPIRRMSVSQKPPSASPALGGHAGLPASPQLYGQSALSVADDPFT